MYHYIACLPASKNKCCGVRLINRLQNEKKRKRSMPPTMYVVSAKKYARAVENTIKPNHNVHTPEWYVRFLGVRHHLFFLRFFEYVTVHHQFTSPANASFFERRFLLSWFYSCSRAPWSSITTKPNSSSEEDHRCPVSRFFYFLATCSMPHLGQNFQSLSTEVPQRGQEEWCSENASLSTCTTSFFFHDDDCWCCCHDGGNELRKAAFVCQSS